MPNNTQPKKRTCSAILLFAKCTAAVALIFVFSYEALAILSIISAVLSQSIPSAQHTSIAFALTIDLILAGLSGYWALRLLKSKKC